MKALKELNKDELLTFIYSYPPGDINIFSEIAACFCCYDGDIEIVKYWYECTKCQSEN